MLRRKFEEVDLDVLEKEYEQFLDMLEANGYVIIRDTRYPESMAVAVSKKI